MFTREMMVLASLVGVHMLWVLLPLLPAILIYRLFPNTSVAVSGPLANLTVRASGAFAGYLVVFAATYPLIGRFVDTIGGFQHPSWTIEGTVKLLDKDGREVQSEALLSKIEMKTKPDPYSAQSYLISMRIPEVEGGLPWIVLEIPTFGRAVTDLKSAPQKIDPYTKTIKITAPITIREVPTSSSYDDKPQLASSR